MQTQTIQKNSEEDIEDQIGCEDCDFTGLIEITEHVSGDNTIPGGYWEGTGEFAKCHCQQDFDDQDE